uniref:Uncharacterized protein n=1 Tax=Meloidogyne javanica TaxID=6303 RepID=A0A915LFT9_MELJA
MNPPKKIILSSDGNNATTSNTFVTQQQGLLLVNKLGSLELHEFLGDQHSSAVQRLIVATIVIVLISAMLVATVILFRCYMLYCQDHLNIRHYQRPPIEEELKGEGSKCVESLASVLISSPFDNFRIECPQTSGAQRLAIRMVESQGQKRQDTVFVLSCQQIGELYPWLEIPEELADQEHEECHYTQQFDILLDKQMNWTCSEREYLAGIARLSDTRIQLECCKLRTRNEGNCVEYDYEKPAGSGARVEIEYQGKLINALAVYGDLIRVRFCDLSPFVRVDIRKNSGDVLKGNTIYRFTTLGVIIYFSNNPNEPMERWQRVTIENIESRSTILAGLQENILYNIQIVPNSREDGRPMWEHSKRMQIRSTSTLKNKLDRERKENSEEKEEDDI